LRADKPVSEEVRLGSEREGENKSERICARKYVVRLKEWMD